MYERKCVICGNKLSGYNKTDECFCHGNHPDYPIRDFMMIGHRPFGALPSSIKVEAMQLQEEGYDNKRP